MQELNIEIPQHVPAEVPSSGKKRILVLNIQSKLGRVIVQYLADKGFAVQTIILSTQQTPLTQQWENQGIKVIKGKIEDRETIMEALNSSYAVVYCSWPLHCKHVQEEADLSKLIIDCSHDMSHLLQNFIYVSSDGVDCKIDVQCLLKRKQIEEYLHSNKGLHSTIIRPVSCMDDLYNVIVDQQFFLLPMGENDDIQLVAAEDVAQVIQQAIENPKEYIGSTLTLCGDALSMKKVHATYEQVTGEKLTLLHTRNASNAAFGMFPQENAPAFDEFRWLHMVGYGGSVEESKKVLPSIMTWKEFCIKRVAQNKAKQQ